MRHALLLASTLLLSNAAWSAQDCSATIQGTDQMTFDKNEIIIPLRCKAFSVTLDHPGDLPKSVMGHNWVLSQDSDMPGIVEDGRLAGEASDYLKPEDHRVIAHTRLLGGGEQQTITIDTTRLKSEINYQFFCSFPFHSSLMKGRLKLGS